MRNNTAAYRLVDAKPRHFWSMLNPAVPRSCLTTLDETFPADA